MAKHVQVVDEGTSRTAVSEGALRTSLDKLTAAQHELHAAEEARKVRDEEVRRAAEEADKTIGLAIEALEAERDRIRDEMQPIEERIRELKAIRSQSGIERLTSPSTVPGAEAVGGVPGVVAGEETDAEAQDGAEGEASQAESQNGDAKESGYEDEWFEVLKEAWVSVDRITQ